MTDNNGCSKQPLPAPCEVRLGLHGAISRSKPPVLQFKDNTWRLWTAYNPRLTEGTYIELNNNGTMQRVTIYPDGSTRYNAL